MSTPSPDQETPLPTSTPEPLDRIAAALERIATATERQAAGIEKQLEQGDVMSGSMQSLGQLMKGPNG